MMLKKDKIKSMRNTYLSGLTVRETCFIENVCQRTMIKYCRDILRSKSEAKKGKMPKNFETFMKAKKEYKITDKHRKEISERNKRLGIVPPSRKGTIPWNFRGITTINERIRKSSDYFNWRKDIFIRDDFVCQICGDKGGRLRAHHIKKFSLYPDLRLEPTNGITICERCDVNFVFHYEEEWEFYFYLNLFSREVIKKLNLK